MGFDVSRSRGSDETLTPARIAGGGFVSTHSGRDTRLNGGQISGERVKVDVGRDLAVITPQAKGYREGFSFGLTLSFVSPGGPLTGFNVRGSVEDGRKAWSAPSAIVGSKGLDIRVGGETTLKAALLQATDGDVKLKTNKLTVQADNKDVDRYAKTGGSIGFDGGGLSGFSFSHEQRNKSGDTRTTVAGKKIEVEVEGLSREETAKVVAALNKDPATFQRVLEDSRFKVSGELDVKALSELPDNIRKVQNFITAQKAIPDPSLVAQGANAVDAWRKLIGNGVSPEEASRVAKGPAFKALVKALNNIDAAIAVHGSLDAIPQSERDVIALGYTLVYSQVNGRKVAEVATACPQNDYGCKIAVDKFLAAFNSNKQLRDSVYAAVANGTLNAIQQGDLATATTHFRHVLYQCLVGPDVGRDLARIYNAHPAAFRELAARQSEFNGGALVRAMEEFKAGGGTAAAEQEFALTMRMGVLKNTGMTPGIKALINIGGFVYEMTPVAAAVGVYEAYQAGSLIGIAIEGVGFIPAGKVMTKLGKGAHALAEALSGKAGRVAKEEAEHAVAGFRAEKHVQDAAAASGKTCVYSCVIDGTTRYVGITDDVARRGAEHLLAKNIKIKEIKGLNNLSRSDARAVEQALIHHYGLGKNGGDLMNLINSISPKRNPTAYEQALIKGKDILDKVGYNWTR